MNIILRDIIHFDDKAARVYGEIRAALETRGHPIGGNRKLAKKKQLGFAEAIEAGR